MAYIQCRQVMGFKVNSHRAWGSVVGHASRCWCLVKIVKLLLIDRHTLLLYRLGSLLLLIGCGRSLRPLFRGNHGSTHLLLYKLLWPSMMGLLLLCLLHFKGHFTTVTEWFALVSGLSWAWVGTRLLNIGLLHDNLRRWQDRWSSIRRVVNLLVLVSCLTIGTCHCVAFQADLATSFLLLRRAFLFARTSFAFLLSRL